MDERSIKTACDEGVDALLLLLPLILLSGICLVKESVGPDPPTPTLADAGTDFFLPVVDLGAKSAGAVVRDFSRHVEQGVRRCCARRHRCRCQRYQHWCGPQLLRAFFGQAAAAAWLPRQHFLLRHLFILAPGHQGQDAEDVRPRRPTAE